MTCLFIRFSLLLFSLGYIGEGQLNAQVESPATSSDTIPVRKNTPVPPPPPPPLTEEEALKAFSDTPRFPGCEDITDREERIKCAHQNLLLFIQKQLQYPKEAAALGIEGKAVVHFVVDKDGSIIDAKVSHDPGFGMGEAAIRAINQMNRQGIKFVPIRSRRRPVKVQFNIPVTFKLDGSIPIEE